MHVKPIKAEMAEFRTVLTAMATEEHSLGDLTADYAQLQTALKTDGQCMTDNEAFSVRAKKMPSFEWGRTYFKVPG